MNDTSIAVKNPAPGTALLDYLRPELHRRDIVLDAAQARALERLQRLYDEFRAFVKARRSLLRRWFSPPVPPRGVYMWGGVGRGKSFLMDAFSAAVPLRRKTRVHFHAFMKGVHDELRLLKQEEDPLATVAAKIARRIAWSASTSSMSPTSPMP